MVIKNFDGYVKVWWFVFKFYGMLLIVSYGLMVIK